MRACGFPGNPGDLFISIAESKPYDGNRLEPNPVLTIIRNRGYSIMTRGFASLRHDAEVA